MVDGTNEYYTLQAMSVFFGGTEIDDQRRLEVTTTKDGFEFTIGPVWVNVYMHDPPHFAWNEEKTGWNSFIRYYPEFSILVVQT